MARSNESVRVLEGGRIVIPASFRRALGLKPGDTIVARLEDDEIRLTTRAQGIERARKLISPYLGPSSMADELLAERRAESE